MVRKKVSEDFLCLVFEIFDFLRQKLLTFFFNITVLLNIWFASKYLMCPLNQGINRLNYNIYLLFLNLSHFFSSLRLSYPIST